MKQYFSNIKNCLRWSFVAIMLLVFEAVYAQPGNPEYSLSATTYFEVDIQPIALLDIETSQATTNISMNVDAPTEAGLGLGANPLVTNTYNWINYSSGVPPSVNRKVQVNINSGTVPTGFEVRLFVSNATGSGGGTLGVPGGGYITLSGSPQDIITGIRGAYTGNGPNHGHQLTYSLHYTGGNFAVIETQSAPINVIYTIIDY